MVMNRRQDNSIGRIDILVELVAALLVIYLQLPGFFMMCAYQQTANSGNLEMVTCEDGKLLPCYSHVVTVTKMSNMKRKVRCVKRQTFNAFDSEIYSITLRDDIFINLFPHV